MITVYDTSEGSLNMGDHIIMQAAKSELKSMFEDGDFKYYSTHKVLSSSELEQAWSNDLAFVCGTNLLRSSWRLRAEKNQWSIRFFDAFKIKPVILFGVGWNSYRDRVKWTARFFYNKALRKDILHSVRDNYTKKKLESCGINNVINTGCPTLWSLTESKLVQIPQSKANSVIFTLTDYRQDRASDTFLIETLAKSYETLYFWPQGSGDEKYLGELMERVEIDNIKINIISNSLSDFDRMLASSDIDYVGTRLHAGIRALQMSKRAIIIGVDNRALEMKKDFNLPVIEREQHQELIESINTNWQPSLNIPWDEIKIWKSQFI